MIIVSSCLTGVKCRYNGSSSYNEALLKMFRTNIYIFVLNYWQVLKFLASHVKFMEAAEKMYWMGKQKVQHVAVVKYTIGVFLLQ